MTDDVRSADLRAEGEPEKEFNPGVAWRLPRKTAAGGVLIRNSAGELLYLEPVYKPTLEIPGGVAEHDESPLEACRREVLEEIGLEIEVGDLLVVDWVPVHGVWFDGLMFIFDGGVLTDEQIGQIELDVSEARGYHFLSLETAQARLKPSLARRIALAEAARHRGKTEYAEFGRGLGSFERVEQLRYVADLSD
jgi:8-oxo-dGTP pyrophosphatase MutT (NUDIX family)